MKKSNRKSVGLVNWALACLLLIFVVTPEAAIANIQLKCSDNSISNSFKIKQATKEEIKDLQGHLKSGEYLQEINGELDSATKKALHQFCLTFEDQEISIPETNPKKPTADLANFLIEKLNEIEVKKLDEIEVKKLDGIEVEKLDEIEVEKLSRSGAHPEIVLVVHLRDSFPAQLSLQIEILSELPSLRCPAPSNVTNRLVVNSRVNRPILAPSQKTLAEAPKHNAQAPCNHHVPSNLLSP
jgi:hypothetical protein